MPAQVLAHITADRDYEAWRSARRCTGGIYRLGSSDAPVIVYGELYGRTLIDLWMEKRGYQEGPEENYDMRQGHLLEDVCAREFALAHGRRVYRRHAILQHPDHPWMIADIDRVISGAGAGDGLGPGILEAKSPRYGTMKDVQQNGPSRALVVQVLHQMAVTGWRWAVLCYYHRDFGVLAYPIHRKGNEDLIEEIIRREEAFWQCLQNDELPPEPEAPPEVQIPEAYRLATAWREGPEWEEAMGRLSRAWAVRDAAKANLEAMEEMFLSARQGVEALLGDIQEVETPWGSVSWKYSKPSQRLDKKRLQAELSLLAGRLEDLAGEGGSAFLHTELTDLAHRVRESLANAHRAGEASRRFLPKFPGEEIQ